MPMNEAVHVPVELYLERLLATIPRAFEPLFAPRGWVLVEVEGQRQAPVWRVIKPRNAGESEGASDGLTPDGASALATHDCSGCTAVGACLREDHARATVIEPPRHPGCACHDDDEQPWTCLTVPLASERCKRYCLCLSLAPDAIENAAAITAVADGVAELLGGAIDAISYLRGLLEEASEGVVLCDSDGSYIDVNQAACEIIGYAREEMLQLNYRDLLAAGEAEQRPIAYAELFAGKTVRVERQLARKDGSKVSVELSGKLTSDGRFIALARDITARRQAERALRESETRNRALADSAFDVIAFLEEGAIIEINQAFADAFQYTREELIGRDITRLLAPGELERITTELANGGSYPVEAAGVRRDGELLDYEACVNRVPHQGREVLLVAGRDITHRKRAAAELARVAAERRELASQVIAAQERERDIIARELHDQIGQMLAVLKMEGDWLAKHADDPGEVTTVAARINSKVDDVLGMVRQLSHSLRPAVLDDLGVCCALESLVNEIARGSDIEFTRDLEDCPKRLPREVETVLYRVAQESLSNMIKHAEARRCWLELHDDGARCSLVVEHDGVDVSPETLTSGRTMGIIGMRERVLPLGGTFELAPRDGGGTALAVSIPYSKG